jgi:hypothetical protein
MMTENSKTTPNSEPQKAPQVNKVNDAPKSEMALSPEVLKAIQSAVEGAVATIAAKMTSVQHPSDFVAPPPSAKPVVPIQAPYESKLKGIPVEAGQDLRHVPTDVIHAWFAKQEHKWKDGYNRRKVAGEQVSMGWTRG